VAATLAYSAFSGSWVAFVVLFFVPDLAFLFYLGGPKVGAYAYNSTHSVIGPMALLIFGRVFEHTEVWPYAALWMAHVGFDRMLGYGLKYTSGFKDTHLGRIGE
jgi:hypothetical protein